MAHLPRPVRPRRRAGAVLRLLGRLAPAWPPPAPRALERHGAPIKVGVTVIALGLGLAVPAAVIASRSAGLGSSSELAGQELTPQLREGKVLFGQNCASCHSLAAANARGATGPNLDELGRLSEDRVRAAIENGGTGDLRMPAGLLEGDQAEAVAAYVSPWPDAEPPEAFSPQIAEAAAGAAHGPRDASDGADTVPPVQGQSGPPARESGTEQRVQGTRKARWPRGGRASLCAVTRHRRGGHEEKRARHARSQRPPPHRRRDRQRSAPARAAARARPESARARPGRAHPQSRMRSSQEARRAELDERTPSASPPPAGRARSS